MAIQSLRLFTSKDCHHPTPISHPPPLPTFFVANARFFIPLSFLLCLVPCGDNEKNPYRDRATIWLNIGLHASILGFIFSCPSMLPLRRPPSSPQPFPALCTFVIIHSQESGKTRVTKRRCHDIPARGKHKIQCLESI